MVVKKGQSAPRQEGGVPQSPSNRKPRTRSHVGWRGTGGGVGGVGGVYLALTILTSPFRRRYHWFGHLFSPVQPSTPSKESVVGRRLQIVNDEMWDQARAVTYLLL